MSQLKRTLSSPALWLGIFTLCALQLCLSVTLNTPRRLSAQGCRMSWMSPSYILQDKFDQSWTPLAKRYSLWLYREVGWEHELHGQPVIFIPGNAGSSHQVRSIASSSTRQFFSSPGVPEMRAPYKPVDYFALEFNEDFSALHGPTLALQIAYARAAVAYVLSLYAPGTQVVVVGHSMGGIVGVSLLPSADIAAVITLATPHALPPARFDPRIEKIYEQNWRTLAVDPTPVVSICGGATDTLIPAESCVLAASPMLGSGVNDSTQASALARVPFRRTVFASALEGAWTGVDHVVMVWCHQVRWRVARAALEVFTARQPTEREAVLDRWLSDGSRLPDAGSYTPSVLHSVDAATIVDGRLRLERPREARVYLLPLDSKPRHFTLLLSGGAVLPVAPHHARSLRASVHLCSSTEHCTPIVPLVHKLLPLPVAGKPFPVPEEGADESEGAVLFEADVPSSEGGYVAVNIEHADGSGWLVAGLDEKRAVTHPATVLTAMFSTITVPLDASALSTFMVLPDLLSHVFLVYRAAARYDSTRICPDRLFPPLLTHISANEAHHHPMLASAPAALLHAHASAPYLASPRRGVELSLHASGEVGCGPGAVDITLDWPATVGRWAPRLWPALVSSSVGITALVLLDALTLAEHSTGVLPPVGATLDVVVWRRLPPLALLALLVGLLPLPATWGLGTSGAALFAPLYPAVIVLGAGLVSLSWALLRVLLYLFGAISSPFGRRVPRPATRRSKRAAALSLGLILALVALFVPWQVAFLGCWLVHLQNTAVRLRAAGASFPPESAGRPTPEAVPLSAFASSADGDETPPPTPLTTAARPTPAPSSDPHAHAHVLLLLTWLLPLAAPVLAVWARTLATAGVGAPFGADHEVLAAAPYLLLVDAAFWVPGALLPRNPRERVSARWGFVVLASVAFLFGARRTYLIFDVAAVVVGVQVLLRVVPQYWS